MQEYRIEKIDGKFMLTKGDGTVADIQSIQDLIIDVPEGGNVAFHKDCARLKYNGYILNVSVAAFGGCHLGKGYTTGKTSIEVVVGGPAIQSINSILLIDWYLRIDYTADVSNRWYWMIYEYDPDEGGMNMLNAWESDAWRSWQTSTFDDIMNEIINYYPFIDE